jgi:UDPglucose 6-dehydrogenase
VVGAGFVGTATGTVLAEHGNDVVYVDVNAERIEMLNKGGGRAVYPEQLDLSDVDFVFISVPTPSAPDGSLVYDFLEQAASNIGERLQLLYSSSGGKLSKRPIIVFRSTMLPGSTRHLIGIIERQSGLQANEHFGVAYMPEYLRERHAVQDFRNPRLILIGGVDHDRRTRHALYELFDGFTAEVKFTTYEDAEYQKYIHNIWNAAKISFFNQIRLIATALGLDPDRVQQMIDLTAVTAEANWNPRYGTQDLGAYDGNCLPKDTDALYARLMQLGVDAPLLTAVRQINTIVADERDPNGKDA